MRGFRLLLSLAAIGIAIPAVAEPISPEKPIDLLAESFEQFLNEKASLSQDFDEVWKKDGEGNLHVTGLGLGYSRTEKEYQNYHLVFEYQWAERTYAGRSDRARDGGVLFHIQGRDQSYGKVWPTCYQVSMIEGGTGGIVVLSTDDTPLSFVSTATNQDPPLWAPDGKEMTFPPEGKKSAHVGWQHRSENWKDVKAFRGELDIENPVGEWNRLEVICDGSTIEIRLNGKITSKATNVVSPHGKIGLQSELAEYKIRRFELFPIGDFDEEWSPESRSSDMGYSITGESILPRRLPLSPEESLTKWELDLPEDYEIRLVAAEPLVCDPVDVVWDENGRMFVAEMRDYPLPNEGEPYLSRIRLLTDSDGDGVMDKSVVWADEMDHVQGLLPMNGGLLATTRTAILFLKDTDGDDKADEIKPLFHSNEPRHNQLQVSSPRYGIDNNIYLSNGLDGKEIYPEGDPDKVLEFPRLNLRYDPREGGLKLSTGTGQYGGTLDAFGRHFFCSNRNPIMFAVMPHEAVKRTPLAAISVGHEDIQPPGAPVRPIALSHTTSAAHAGTHTAACGIGVYTGDWLPDLTGDVFVCDPTAQLVTRNTLIPKGATFSAERVGEDREFLASGDEWCRPVQVRNGPDGALYIVDMYRRFIDHARFFPEEFSKSHYMRAGFDQGRIWKIAPKGESRTTAPLPDKPEELVAALSNPNGWTRTNAQRIIVEKQLKEVVPLLRETLADPETEPAMAHCLGTLEGLGELSAEDLCLAFETPWTFSTTEPALEFASEMELTQQLEKHILSFGNAESSRMRFLALSLFPDLPWNVETLAKGIARSPEDTWFRKAVMSSIPDSAPSILSSLLKNETFLSKNNEGSGETLEDFARLTANLGNIEALQQTLALLEGDPKWWHFEVVSGLSTGLRASPLKQKSVAALISAAPPELGEGVNTLQKLLSSASEIALDRSRPEADRITALSLVAQQPWEEKTEIVEKLLQPSEAPAIQAAAVQMLSRDNRETVAQFFFDRWDSLAPTPLREALALITGNTKSGLALMKRMQAGEINPAIMPPMTRWSYGRSSNEEIKSLALELFGQASANRAKVIKEFGAALDSHPGDPAKGELVFQTATCFTCHKVGEIGMDVGPSLNDVKIKPAEALLTDILDPNRAVEERWVSMTIETKEGRVLTGLVASEDSASVNLRLPGGLTESIPRIEIAKVSSTGMSLMPEGLEAAMSKEDMANLIAFLKKR